MKTGASIRGVRGPGSQHEADPGRLLHQHGREYEFGQPSSISVGGTDGIAFLSNGALYSHTQTQLQLTSASTGRVCVITVTPTVESRSSSRLGSGADASGQVKAHRSGHILEAE